METTKQAFPRAARLGGCLTGLRSTKGRKRVITEKNITRGEGEVQQKVMEEHQESRVGRRPYCGGYMEDQKDGYCAP